MSTDPMESLSSASSSQDVQPDVSPPAPSEEEKLLIGTGRVAGTTLHLKGRAAPKVFARPEKSILRKGDAEQSTEEQQRAAKRNAEAAKKYESVRKKFIEVRKKLIGLANPVLAWKEPVAETAPQPSSKEISKRLVAVLKEFDEATADANDVLDLQSLRGMFEDLISSDWVVDACNGPKSHRIERMLRNSVIQLLQKEIALSPPYFTTGIQLLQSISRMHKAGAESVHRRIYNVIDDVFEKTSIKPIRSRSLDEKQVVASLLEEGITTEEQAARAEQFIRSLSTKQEASVLTNALRNKKVGQLFDSASKESLLSRLTPEGKRRYGELFTKVQAFPRG